MRLSRSESTRSRHRSRRSSFPHHPHESTVRHFATVCTLQRDVIQRPILNRLACSRQPHIDMRNHAFVNGIIMLGNPADRLTHLEAFKLRQKADMPQVHAKNRHTGAVHQFSRSKNGAIPAEHHHDLSTFRNHRRLLAEIRRSILSMIDTSKPAWVSCPTAPQPPCHSPSDDYASPPPHDGYRTSLIPFQQKETPYGKRP